jgi:uncharacterized protein DUF4397
MRIHRPWGAVASILLAAVACSKPSNQRVQSQAGGEASVAPSADSAKAREVALVRVINAIPAPIDIYAGDSAKFRGVDFKAVTSYETLSQDVPLFKAVGAGQSNAKPMAEEHSVARDGHYYTVIAFGTAAKPQPGTKPDSSTRTATLEVIRDDLVPGDSTKARLRVFNAAPNAGKLDVFIPGSKDPLFNNVDVKDDNGFKDIDPGTKTLVVRPNNKHAVLLEVTNIVLRPGQSMTLVLTHPSATSSKLVAIKVTDELKPPGATPRGD